MRWRIDGVEAVAAAEYAGEVRALVLACKEQGRADVASVLAAVLARLIGELPAGHLVLVPGSKAGWVRRGFHPVQLLVQRAGRSGVLLRSGAGGGAGGQQKTRSRDERLAAALDLRVPPRYRQRLVGTPCIVLDDVVTTGATMRSALAAVRAAGGIPVAVVALARVTALGPSSRR